jgi:hypothetical protein
VVEVEGKPYRRAGRVSTISESGQDWFGLSGQADFEGELVELPAVLSAVRWRPQWVRL